MQLKYKNNINKIYKPKYENENGIIELIKGKIKIPEIYGAWSEISACLPHWSVYKLIKRKFNPDNYKGKWTKEEEQKLLYLYESEERKWELIGEELDKTAGNCRNEKLVYGKSVKKELKSCKGKRLRWVVRAKKN